MDRSSFSLGTAYVFDYLGHQLTGVLTRMSTDGYVTLRTKRGAYSIQDVDVLRTAEVRIGE